jgi:hypothetical protein
MPYGGKKKDILQVHLFVFSLTIYHNARYSNIKLWSLQLALAIVCIGEVDSPLLADILVLGFYTECWLS